VGNRGDKRRSKKRRARTTTGPPNPHVEVIVESLASVGTLLRDVVSAADPVADVDARIASAIGDLTHALVGIEPAGTMEVIRMFFLPWLGDTETGHAGAEGGASIAEVLALALLCSTEKVDPDALRPVDQEVCGVISEHLAPKAREFLDLTSVRDLLVAESFEPIDRIAFDVKAAGKWMRSSSYADMQADTLRGLFGHADVRDLVEQELGFSVGNAILFLETCHEMQTELLNRRGRGITDAWNRITTDGGPAPPTEEQKNLMREAFTDLFNPSAELASISLGDLAKRVGVDESHATLMASFFSLDVAPGAERLLAQLADGDSPFRASPLIALGDRVMLLHPAQIQDAIKDSFETTLASTDSWETYQQHRGKYLEGRIQDLVARVLPGANAYHGLEYFIPKDEAEAAGDPSAYSKLVEGDHLFVLDDVGVIVEDKAIPLTARSRSGEAEPLRKNLARAITKGAAQAGRLKERIIADRGLRLRDGGWLDLTAVRELHTVVTSLDDLSGVSTATSLLVNAGLLVSDNIPWTVSLHDLDLITRLVDRPAEFLLYLRRRTNPLTTVMFTAVDELDLFLAFFKTGLYVEPDPTRMARELPWMSSATPGAIRRYKKQVPTLITSQTDALDAWHFSLHPPSGATARNTAPKPTMVTSPVGELLDLLQSRRVFGWLSVSATLLEGSTQAQQQLARCGPDLASMTRADQIFHSLATPLGSSLPECWLIVWTSRPRTMKTSEAKARTEAYLVAKREQYKIPRGFAFLYDGATGGLLYPTYDAGELTVDQDLIAQARADLREVGDIDTRAQVTAKLRGRQRLAG
jgi:hypothetical protein